MKELDVKKVSMANIPVESVPALLDEEKVAFQPVNTVNWAAYPYCPDVKFRIAYTDNAILIHYKVKEAKETEDDEFTVTVEVCPFTAFSTVSDELDQWVTDTYSNVESIPSDEELNEAIMRKMYEIMSAKLADPTYGDKMEKEVHVKVNKDGAYYIPNDDLMAVDDALFPQNQL